MDIFPLAPQPSFYICLEGLHGSNLKELAELLKASIHKLPSTISRLYQRFWLRILLKIQTTVLGLVMLQSLPQQVLWSMHNHSRCIIASGRFWQQITETSLKWLKDKHTYCYTHKKHEVTEAQLLRSVSVSLCPQAIPVKVARQTFIKGIVF